MKIRYMGVENIRKVAILFEDHQGKYGIDSRPDFEALKELENIVGEIHEESSKDYEGVGPVVSIKWDRVVELKISSHIVSSFPECITKLTALRYLSFWGNSLTSIPDSIGRLTALEELHFHNNSLSSLPDSIGLLKSLTSLNLSINYFASLHDSFSQLSSLKNLFLDYNRFNSFPEPVARLSSLEKLIVKNNMLT